MSVPNPPFELAGHCTTIYNNIFYVYSPAGFASLPLQQNATWSTLPSGASVTNAECVKAETSNSAADAFYVVGGSANATAGNYPGLQRYIFSTGKWETITPTVPVTQNRRNHGATYLSGTNSLFVYAGSQQAGSSGMSSQTFLISTLPPFQVLSFNSAAPPLTAPMVMTLSSTKALMVGGAANSKAVYTWSKEEGWLNLGTTLPAPIVPSAVQCNLVTGDDGSKVLEEYNMAATPNEVTRYVLLTPDGKPGAPGQTVGAATSRKRKRDLTLASWPAYNNTLAPVVARSDYSLAESANGLTVISGGNVLSPLAMFNSKQNTWINASSFLGKAEQVPLASTTSSALPSVTVVNNSASSTVASAPTSSSTGLGDAASTTENTSSKTGKVLGATLGVVVGLGLALTLILVLLRQCRKRRQRKGQNYLNEKDDRLSFADQGADFMPQAGGAVGKGFSGAPSRDSRSTIGSLQFFNKNMRKSGHTRAAPSDASNLNLVMHAKSPLGATDPLEMARMEKEAGTFGPGNKGAGPAPKGRDLTPTSATPTRSRSIGWSSYFTKNETVPLPTSSASNRPFFGRKSVQDDRASALSGSDYGEIQSRVLSGASTVRPLELNLGPKFEGQRLSQVSSGSPILESRGDDFGHGQTAEIGHSGLNPGVINASRYTANQNPFVSPLITDGASFTKPKVKDWDTKSISSIGSTKSQAYFQGGTNPYHENDPTLAYFPAKSPKTPTTPAFPSTLTNPIPPFPRPANGLPAHPGPTAKKATTPQAYDFPLPKAYFASDGQVRDSGSTTETLTNFPRGFTETPQIQSPAILQQPAAVAKPKVIQVRSTSPTAAEKKLGLPAGSVKTSKGPQLRKMTGDEDMSWLNIGSG